MADSVYDPDDQTSLQALQAAISVRASLSGRGRRNSLPTREARPLRKVRQLCHICMKMRAHRLIPCRPKLRSFANRACHLCASHAERNRGSAPNVRGQGKRFGAFWVLSRPSWNRFGLARSLRAPQLPEETVAAPEGASIRLEPPTLLVPLSASRILPVFSAA